MPVPSAAADVEAEWSTGVGSTFLMLNGCSASTSAEGENARPKSPDDGASTGQRLIKFANAAREKERDPSQLTGQHALMSANPPGFENSQSRGSWRLSDRACL